jgi:hypothetical protein
VAHGAGLAGDAAAVDVDLDVELAAVRVVSKGITATVCSTLRPK